MKILAISTSSITRMSGRNPILLLKKCLKGTNKLLIENGRQRGEREREWRYERSLEETVLHAMGGAGRLIVWKRIGPMGLVLLARRE
jgi:hypothetical protein